MSAQKPIAMDDLPTEPGSRIVRAAQAGAWQDGFELLAAASQAASQIEENARSTYASAYESGYEEGRAAGTEEASRLVRDITLAVDGYLATLKNEIASLAMSVVQRIFGEFDVADLVARAATEALAEFRQEKNLKMAVHPTAVDRVRAALEPLTHRGLAVTVEANPDLDEGACIIASDFAVIDASLDVQLRALATGLASANETAAV